MSNLTSAIVIIGDEILSGRTADVNTQYIARKLSDHGIALKEARIIADEHDTIVATISSLRSKYNYIFTTGGIGPTHDDITAQAIADVFDTPLQKHKVAFDILQKFYSDQDKEFNLARQKMAYLPQGCTLIDNEVSAAPGFICGNVFVMAGVPHIMQAMFDNVLSSLDRGQAFESRQCTIMIGESLAADLFSKLQAKFPNIQMGSYPFETNDNMHGTSLVLRSSNKSELDEAYQELQDIVQKLRKEYNVY